ncbi:protein FAM91A1-like isoform X2 [Liolophura sinensis]|uniref:protein FAM91A1-like isoform X2 n=1 Tax=Liolophura sinensis TaxID=3198878 RepID=UPI00315909BD
MNSDVEYYIKHNYTWAKLPANIKQVVGNAQREYEKAILLFSVKNQLRYKGNLVKTVRKDERRYYEELLQYSQDHLMLYPYHLSDVIVKGLRVTPFSYYISIMSDIMTQEKSYDSLPNFTAADCLRLLGIGRNQYIDLMNQCRSSKKFFRKKPVKELLPTQPVESVSIDSWWLVNIGYITEDDIKMCMIIEKSVIDVIIDSGTQTAGDLDYRVLHSLYRKGLVYLDVPVSDDDCIIVPPLEGFVMNRVLGDYFETLLYKIFVSIDEHTPVSELATVLEIDLQLVKNAVSMFCRLGFAKKKQVESAQEDLHPSWKGAQSSAKKPSRTSEEHMLIDWTSTTLTEMSLHAETSSTSPETSSVEGVIESSSSSSQIAAPVAGTKRVAFLFDSTLTAFLMMGNLSPGLKSHAVTMFEVGKLSDESLDSFLAELEKVGDDAEGEARRYFDHAITLRDTIRFLRHNKSLCPDPDQLTAGLAIDLIRCESLLGLDPATRARVLNKNYMLLVSMAPLSNEIRPVSSCTPQHIGPAIPEVNSVWFKLYIYHLTGNGPPSVLLVKGTKLRKLPKVLQDCDRLLVTTWGHDPGVIATSNIMLTLNDALTHSAVLIQGHGCHSEDQTVFVPFPLQKDTGPFSRHHLHNHSAVQKLASLLDLKHTCGYITLLNQGRYHPYSGGRQAEYDPFMETPKLSGGSSVSASSENIDKPTNGIKDLMSAEMLASEIDSLDPATVEKESLQERDKLTLNLAETDAKGPLAADGLGEQDWCLLDCFFGVPLFDSDLNKEVCQRISSNSLCTKESLQDLLHSSRKLSLQLLNFISQYQDVPGQAEPSVDKSLSEDLSEVIPYPTQNLVFAKGKLQKWNGQ